MAGIADPGASKYATPVWIGLSSTITPTNTVAAQIPVGNAPAGVAVVRAAGAAARLRAAIDAAL